VEFPAAPATPALERISQGLAFVARSRSSMRRLLSRLRLGHGTRSARTIPRVAILGGVA
jgi:hypothetical protein